MKKIIPILLLVAILLSACSVGNHSTSTTGTASTTGTTGSGCSTHSDSNDDGICDSCTLSLMVAIDLYAINDLHGKLADGNNHIGVDELTTFWKNEQADGNVILLSTGDMWQGSSESNLTHGNIITDWMNDLNFAAMTLGNHEYDWGEDAIRANVEIAEFPVLAINIYDRDTNQRVDYCDASTVVDLGEVQIGIIGAMGDCYSSIASDKTEGVYFKVGSELTRLVKEESQRLRTECGVDFVVYVIHDGHGSSTSSSHMDRPGSYYNTELSNGYVDLVFEGHSHQAYCFTDEHGVYHMQNRGDNKGGVSHAQLNINYVTGSFTVDATLISYNSYSQEADDPIVESLLEKYKEQISPANRVLGTNSRYRSREELGALVAELYYELGLSYWGDQYTITMGGGSLSTRSPYNLKAGEVKYSDLQSLFPFDNEIRLCAIKGKELKRCFLRWDNYYAIGACGALKESDIDDNAIYYVVLDTWTSNYDAIDLTIVEYYTPGIYARDLLAEYIASGGLE